jgi:hypothetical protein
VICLIAASGISLIPVDFRECDAVDASDIFLPGGWFMGNINLLEVLVATLASFAVGGLWFAPFVFGKQWMRANNFTEEDLKRGSPPVIFGVAFVLSFIMALNLAFFVSGPEVGLGYALVASLAAGLGWAAMGLAVVALFERRGWDYILVNGGYLVVSFLAMGLVYGLWP